MKEHNTTCNGGAHHSKHRYTANIHACIRAYTCAYIRVHICHTCTRMRVRSHPDHRTHIHTHTHTHTYGIPGTHTYSSGEPDRFDDR